MTTMASQITSLTVVYSSVYSDADQRKHQSSASLAFVRGFHRDWWIPRTKGQLRGKCFHLMTSSWFSALCEECISGQKGQQCGALVFLSLFFCCCFCYCYCCCYCQPELAGEQTIGCRGFETPGRSCDVVIRIASCYEDYFLNYKVMCT